MNELRKKLDALVSGDESARILERVKFRKENKAWLDKSGDIAITVLFTLDAQNITQKVFAERMGISPQQVSKILQGNENLSLQTITNMEAALGIELINIHFPSTAKWKKQQGLKKNKS